MLLLLGSASQAEPLRLRCRPHDCQVYVVRQGLAPELVGNATEILNLEPAAELLLKRKGWKPTSVFLPRNLGALYPDEGEPTLELAPDPEAPGARRLYSLIQNWWKVLLALLGMGLLAGVIRRRGSRRKPQTLAELEENLLERGPLTMQTLGNYLLLEPLSEGGMAHIYRAMNRETLDTSRPVAVKVLKRAYCEDPEYIKRWKREAQITSSMEHPNLVRVLDWGEQEGIHYMVMELLKGKPLRALVRSGGLPWKEAVRTLLPVLEAIQEVHLQGVVHRDLNPDNIVLLNNNTVKVIDFGIARGEEFTKATQTGVVMGTPSYVAPEQLLGKIEPATDQYALGTLLYELLTGAPPFQGSDPMDVMTQHLGRQIPPIGEKRPDLPSDLQEVVMTMLNREPERRFSDMAEAGLALRDVLEA